MKRTLEQLYAPVQAELHEVRAAMDGLWGSALELVGGPSDSPPKTGGKLLRPALCLLSAGAIGAQDLGRFVRLGLATEVLHVAALVHDDVVDRAGLRRGNPSLNAMWNDRIAVLSGDYLVSRATGILTEYGSCDVIACMNDAVRLMTEGELETFGTDRDAFTEADCLRTAKLKTATLFAATCCLPTYLIDGGGAFREALEAYGLALGIAFQVTDDILDLVQNTATLGKPSCGDLVEGKQTLPILFLREKLNEADRERLAGFRGQTLTDDDREWVSGKLEATGALSRARAVSEDYVNRAQSALSALAETPFKEAMLGLTNFVVDRAS